MKIIISNNYGGEICTIKFDREDEEYFGVAAKINGYIETNGLRMQHVKSLGKFVNESLIFKIPKNVIPSFENKNFKVVYEIECEKIYKDKKEKITVPFVIWNNNMSDFDYTEPLVIDLTTVDESEYIRNKEVVCKILLENIESMSNPRKYFESNLIKEASVEDTIEPISFIERKQEFDVSPVSSVSSVSEIQISSTEDTNREGVNDQIKQDILSPVSSVSEIQISSTEDINRESGNDQIKHDINIQESEEAKLKANNTVNNEIDIQEDKDAELEANDINREIKDNTNNNQINKEIKDNTNNNQINKEFNITVNNEINKEIKDNTNNDKINKEIKDDANNKEVNNNKDNKSEEDILIKKLPDEILDDVNLLAENLVRSIPKTNESQLDYQDETETRKVAETIKQGLGNVLTKMFEEKCKIDSEMQCFFEKTQREMIVPVFAEPNIYEIPASENIFVLVENDEKIGKVFTPNCIIQKGYVKLTYLKNIRNTKIEIWREDVENGELIDTEQVFSLLIDSENCLEKIVDFEIEGFTLKNFIFEVSYYLTVIFDSYECRIPINIISPNTLIARRDSMDFLSK